MVAAHNLQHPRCTSALPTNMEAKLDQVLVSIPDAGKALALGRSKIYDLIAEGRLETITIGRRRLVRVESVRALADARTAA